MDRTSIGKRVVLCGAGALLLALVAGDASAVDVAACGVTVPAGQTGRLVQDVTCGWVCTSDHATPCTYSDPLEEWECPTGGLCEAQSMRLGRNATLDLAGHDLRATYNQPTIFCTDDARPGRCTVRGPGTIFAEKDRPVVGHAQDVVLRDLTIDNSYGGVETAGRISLDRVQTYAGDGVIRAGRALRARDVTMTSGLRLESGGPMTLERVHVARGITAAGTLRGRDVVAVEGGVSGRDVFLTRATVPEPPVLDLSTDAHVSAANRLVLRDSAAGRIESGKRPRLVRSTCAESRRVGAPGSWGVCATD